MTWGELICGAEKSDQAQRNLCDLEGFSARLEILPFNEQASTPFVQVKAELELQGTKIGGYDTMIAAQFQCGRPLTNNLNQTRHSEF